MTVQTLIARLATSALLAVAGSAALAQEIIVVPDTFVSMKSRAEVLAEVVAARVAGHLNKDGEAASAMSQFPATPSTTPRETVRAELRNAPHPDVMMYNPAA